MSRFLKFPMLLLAGLALASCAQIERTPPLAQRDDEGYCKANGGEPGSKAFAECLRNRDAQAASSSRLDKAHRRLSEDILVGR